MNESNNDTVVIERGRSTVEEKLVNAACLLLAEKGPKVLSNRDIARLAGVNHGQIHHYFGSKYALLKAAMSKLSRDHWDQTHTNGYLPLKGLERGQAYALAVVRCAIDGEIELATQHIRDKISVPKKVLDNVIEHQSASRTPTDAKCHVAIPIAIEMGWAVLEPYIFATLDVKPDEIEVVRGHVIATLETMLKDMSFT